MHQCQCDQVDSFQNKPPASAETMNNSTPEPEADTSHASTGEVGLALEQSSSQPDMPESGPESLEVEARPTNDNAHHDVNGNVKPVQQKTENPDHLQSSGCLNNMKNNEEMPPLQPCHRNIPSNQANVAMGSTTNCITGFQSTFSQEGTCLPEPCKPTGYSVIECPPHFTDPLPGSSCQHHPWQAQQHQQFHQNQFISANVNNNASPTNYHGFERPNYGLVQQVLEVFRLCGKAEMQPSEVYYELEKQFPYYRYLTPQKRKSWMSSVRHALTNPQFKARRCTDDDGKPANRRGNFWSIDENYVPGQENTPTRPQQAYRRRSKLKSPAGVFISGSSPGQLISEPLAGTSLMSPPIGYPNMQSNGIPVILPTAQFAGQALQLVPTINSGMGGNTAYPKQSPGVNSGQFLWIPPPNSSPQQQQQQQQLYNGNTWHTPPIAAFNPAFNGNMQQTNYNYSNNVQQQQQQQQLRQNLQQQQLQQYQQPLRNSTVLRHIAPSPTPNPHNNVTAAQNRVSVVEAVKLSTNVLSDQNTPIKTLDVHVGEVTKCDAVDQSGDNTLMQQDIGPGGDTSPAQHTNLETVDTQDFSQSSQEAPSQHSESQGESEIAIENAESQNMETGEEDKSNNYQTGVLERPEATDEQSSCDPSSASQVKNGLFPVTLYTSSNSSNPDDEKTVLPSIEQLTKSLTNQTVGPCSALGQISSIAPVERESARNIDRTEVANDKNTPEGKAELRAMVFREVCNTNAEPDLSPASVIPSLEMTPEATNHPTNTATVTAPYTIAIPSSTDTFISKESDGNGQWHVQQDLY